MKKIILVAGMLLFASNGWAENYDQCAAKAADDATNANEYDEYIEACRLIDRIEEKYIGLKCDRNNRYENLWAVLHIVEADGVARWWKSSLYTLEHYSGLLMAQKHQLRRVEELHYVFEDTPSRLYINERWKHDWQKDSREEYLEDSGWRIDRSSLQIVRVGVNDEEDGLVERTYDKCEMVDDGKSLREEMLQRNRELREGIEKSRQQRLKERKF